MHFSLKKTKIFGAVFVFLISLGVYCFTLAPTIVPGDNPEIITAAYNLGTAHPPGYPLFTLILKIFIVIFPFGNIAWRANLFNAILSSLTILVVYFIIYKLTKKISLEEKNNLDIKHKKPKVTDYLLSIIPAIIGSLFLAFSSAFWLYSIAVEIFSLNNLFVALLVFIILAWREKVLKGEKDKKLLWLLAFVAGLSFTNQQAIVFIAPPLLFLFFATKRKLFAALKSIPLMVLFFILGLTPYFYLLISARFGSAFHWGNPNNLSNLIGVILRQGYGGVSLYPKSSSFLSLYETWGENFWFFIKYLYYHFTAIGILFGSIGLYCLRKKKTIFIFLLSTFLFLGIFFFFYLGNLKLEDIVLLTVAERFILSSEVIFSLFLGIGVYFLFKKVLPYIKFRLITIIVLIVFAFSPLIPLFSHYASIKKTDNYLLYNFGRDFLNSLDKGSLLISDGDMMFFSTMYLQNVENLRPDVKIIHWPLLFANWYVDYLKNKYPDIKIPFDKINGSKDVITKTKELISENINKRSIYFPVIEESQLLNPDYFLLQRELLFQVIKGKPKFTPSEYIKQNNAFYEKSELNKNYNLSEIKFDKKYPFSAWWREINLNFVISHHNKCLLLYDLKRDQEAEKECQIAISAMPEFLPPYFTLAKNAFNKGEYKKAVEIYEQVTKIDPENKDAYKNLFYIYRDSLKDEKKAIEYRDKFVENNLQ